MYLKDKHLILSFLCILASCASDNGPYKWHQFRGSVGFEEADSYCQKLAEIRHSYTTQSIFDTLMIGVAGSTGGLSGMNGYMEGMQNRPQTSIGMSLEECMEAKGWRKVPIQNPN